MKKEITKSKNIAIVDLETLSLEVNTAIVSIGCVVVDIQNLFIKSKFYRICDAQEQINNGRITDDSTLGFWEKQKEQSPLAYKEMQTACLAYCLPTESYKVIPLKKALSELSDFLSWCSMDTLQLMGNGPEFDNAILSHAYKHCGFSELPWKYWNNQSLRTVLWMGENVLGINPKNDIPFKGTKHHALDDAVYEAELLIAVLKAFQENQRKVAA